MRVVDGPEVVDEDVEDGEDEDEEDGGPLGLEADGDHHAGDEADDGHEDAREAPLALEDEAEEEEDQEDAAREKEAGAKGGKSELVDPTGGDLASRGYSLLLAVGVADLGEAGEPGAPVDHRVGEDHEEAAHDGEVAEEEIEVEDEAVAEPLDDHDAEEAGDGVFGVLLAHDRARGDDHGEYVGDQEEVGDAPGEMPVSGEKGVWSEGSRTDAG